MLEYAPGVLNQVLCLLKTQLQDQIQIKKKKMFNRLPNKLRLQTKTMHHLWLFNHLHDKENTVMRLQLFKEGQIHLTSKQRPFK